MKRPLLILCLLFGFTAVAQSLGRERVERLNRSIVKIKLDTLGSGTGFVVREDGWIATCRHVIEPLNYTDANGQVKMRPIYAIFNNGEKVELGVLNYQLHDQTGYDESKAFDLVLLKLQSIPNFDYQPLRVGTWDEIYDGDEVYTCGFPVSVPQRIISKGIVSSKWVQKVPLKDAKGNVLRYYKRDAAWADMTVNKGNSGGPVIKLGETPEDDAVIGIASFILNPAGREADKIYSAYKNLKNDNDNVVDLQEQLEVLFRSATYNNIGLSGVISSDYLYKVLSRLDRSQ